MENVLGRSWWKFLVYNIKVIKYIIYVYYNIHTFVLNYISTTHTGKLQESKMFVSGIIYYTCVPSKKSEGRYTEIFKHVMMKVRIYIEHEWNVYFLTSTILHILSLCKLL